MATPVPGSPEACDAVEIIACTQLRPQKGSPHVGKQLWLQGPSRGIAGVLGWIETLLLISCYSLIVSQAAEACWPHGGRVTEGRRTERRPSAGRDNAGFLLPSVKVLRGMTPTTYCFSLPWTASSQANVPATQIPLPASAAGASDGLPAGWA